MSIADVLTNQELRQLATLGYVSLEASRHPELVSCSEALFSVSSQYFAADPQAEAKQRYRAASGPGASEEGHSVIPGEKQIFTCRGYTRTPAALKEDAKCMWDATGVLLRRVLQMIARDLDLAADTFEPLLQDCVTFQEKRTPSLLRLFRYDRPRLLGTDATTLQDVSVVVAERHKDLGLLSLVVGSTPGLEVFNDVTHEWISIEEPKKVQTETASTLGSSNLSFTLLGGQCLRYLTRGQYKAGVHRVRCSSRSSAAGLLEPYRYSIVYALRPYPSILTLSSFESERTGTFTEQEKAGVDGQVAQVLFDTLCRQHWNVNIAKDIRREQQNETNQGLMPMKMAGPPVHAPSDIKRAGDRPADLNAKPRRKRWWRLPFRLNSQSS